MTAAAARRFTSILWHRFDTRVQDLSEWWRAILRSHQTVSLRWQHDPKLPDVVHFNDYVATHSLDDDLLDECAPSFDRIEGKDVPAHGVDGLRHSTSCLKSQ